MVAVTSVMRAHQILLARVENALRPYDLSFSRFELLRLLAFSRSGALPITKASDRLQVHVTSVTHAIRRLEANGLVQRVPHPTDGRTVASAGTDGKVQVWDYLSRNKFVTLPGSPDAVRLRVAYSPDGRRLAMCAGRDRIVRVDRKSVV